MNSNRSFALFILFLLISAGVQAKIWRVDSNPGNWADFRTLQAANDSSYVMDGDTLYVSGGPAGYGNVTFQKRLVIIGPGYFLAENPSTQANPSAATAGTITFTNGAADWSVMIGMTASYVYVSASSITIRRNHFTGWVYIGWNNSVTNVVFSQCYAAGISVANTSNSIIISNNIIPGNVSSPSTSSVLVVNNVINFVGYQNGIDVQNSVVENNVLYSGTSVTPTGNTFLNNIGNGIQFPLTNGNQQNVDMATVFELAGSTDGKYMLKQGSPGLLAGTNGYDIGAYGGPGAYVLSGIPPIPTIYNVSAPTFGSEAQGLQVQVKAKSRN